MTLKPRENGNIKQTDTEVVESSEMELINHSMKMKM